MPVNAHPVAEDEVMAHLDGELEPARVPAVAAHLSTCEECQSLAADLQSVSRHLQEWQIDQQAELQLASAARRELANRPQALRARQRLKWFGFAAAASLAVIVVVSDSHRSSEYRKLQHIESSETVESSEQRVMGGTGTGAQRLVGPFKQFVGSAPEPGQMLEKTAYLTVTVQQTEAGRIKLSEITRDYNGYIGEIELSTGSNGTKSLKALIRIPANSLEPALSAMRAVGRVESDSENSQDVSSQSVDLEARLSNSRTEEQRLNSLLHHSGTLQDVLAVEERISGVRGEIEQMEAERKLMASRVSFAAVHVKLNQASSDKNPGSLRNRVSGAAARGFRNVADLSMELFLSVLEYGPTALLVLAVFALPAWLLWRRLRLKAPTERV